MSARESRGGRRSSSGQHSANRLRGGFLASRLPAVRGGTSQPLSPEQTSDHDSSTQSLTFRSHDDTSDSDGSSGGSGSLLGICRSIQEQLRSVARRMVVVEQQQKQLSNAVKEIATLMKQQEKASFSIKDSPLEVLKACCKIVTILVPLASTIAACFEGSGCKVILFFFDERPLTI